MIVDAHQHLGDCRVFDAEVSEAEVLSSLDLEATPPLEYAHDHFGYRDRLSQPTIEGLIEEFNEQAAPGIGPPSKAGEFFLGYPDEEGVIPPLPQPEKDLLCCVPRIFRTCRCRTDRRPSK